MIKEAVEKMFPGTKVDKRKHNELLTVRTRRRGMVVGKTAKTKKAIVKLTADSKDIEIFAGSVIFETMRQPKPRYEK